MSNRNRIFLTSSLVVVTGIAFGEQPNIGIATVLSTKQAKQLEQKTTSAA